MTDDLTRSIGPREVISTRLSPQGFALIEYPTERDRFPVIRAAGTREHCERFLRDPIQRHRMRWEPWSI